MSLKALAKQVKKENKELEKTTEELFLTAIDEFLVTPSKSTSPQRLAFRPSSYYKCHRAVFYFLNGEVEKKKKYPRSERILQVGTKLHEWVQRDVFMKMAKKKNSPIKLLDEKELPSFGKPGFEIVKEHLAPPMEIKFLDYRWTTKYPISAMVDGYMTFNNLHFLFEFKTINPDDFELLIEPLVDHIKQGAIYALCTGIHQVMFLYLCKGTQHWKAYLIRYKPEQLDWVKNRVQSIESYVLKGEIPPKEVDSNCQWCGYKHLCEKAV